MPSTSAAAETPEADTVLAPFAPPAGGYGRARPAQMPTSNSAFKGLLKFNH